MITDDAQLMAAQARVQVVQTLLAQGRRTLTPESYQDFSKGWLREWERLEQEIRTYLSKSANISEPAHSAT